MCEFSGGCFFSQVFFEHGVNHGKPSKCQLFVGKVMINPYLLGVPNFQTKSFRSQLGLSQTLREHIKC